MKVEEPDCFICSVSNFSQIINSPKLASSSLYCVSNRTILIDYAFFLCRMSVSSFGHFLQSTNWLDFLQFGAWYPLILGTLLVETERVRPHLLCPRRLLQHGDSRPSRGSNRIEMPMYWACFWELWWFLWCRRLVMMWLLPVWLTNQGIRWSLVELRLWAGSDPLYHGTTLG